MEIQNYGVSIVLITNTKYVCVFKDDIHGIEETLAGSVLINYVVNGLNKSQTLTPSEITSPSTFGDARSLSTYLNQIAPQGSEDPAVIGRSAWEKIFLHSTYK